MLRPTDERLRALPKAELHVHLDGSLRPGTMLDLAGERGVSLPVHEAAALARYMVVSDAANLEDYLARFDLTLSVMQDTEALERITYELVEDHAQENVRYLEIRFCPMLNTRGGLASDEVLDAALRGARRGQEDFSVRTNIIVCALRSLPAAISIEMAELAVAYADRGVCAFDIAGGEAGNPVKDHLDALHYARDAGLPITIHAGEGFGPASIRQAIEDGGARRIGHGTRLGEDPQLLADVRRLGILLEVCITSNVQTRVARTHSEHPVRGYFEQDVPVSLCTDNRMMSGVELTEEFVLARNELGFGWNDLVRMARMGFEHAFVSPEERATLMAAFDRELASLT